MEKQIGKSKMPRYRIIDSCTGHIFCRHDDYDRIAHTYFHILDHEYGGEDNDTLFVVDNEANGRAVSVICREDFND